MKGKILQFIQKCEQTATKYFDISFTSKTILIPYFMFGFAYSEQPYTAF
jgi:hypothetical protein